MKNPEHITLEQSRKPKKKGPHWHSAFGSARSGPEPVILLLQAGHYQLLQRKAGKQLPKPLASAEPAKLNSAAFRGGGKSCASSSRHSWRPQGTPDSGKTPTEHPPKFEIPQSAKSKRRDTLSRTHVVKTAGASPQYPDVSTATCGKRKGTSIATKEARSKTQRGSRAGTLQEIDPEDFQVQVAEDTTVNRIDSFQWTCNLCDQVFRGKFLKSIECSRRRHIAKTHPKQGHLVNLPVRRKAQIVEPSVYIPEDQRMWSCPKCFKGFHYMSKRMLKLSKDAHLTKCYGMTLKKLRSLKYNSPHWKAHHKQLVQDNAQNKKDKSDKKIQEYNNDNDACIFRIPAYRERSSDQFGCAKCSKIFQKTKEAMQHICPGYEGRHAVTENPCRRKFWAKKRKINPELIHHLVKNWKLTHKECNILERGLTTNGGRNGIVPASKSAWYADLTEHGDVEPNPGPHSEDEPSWSGCMTNCAGKETCWSFVRHVIQHKHDIAIAQEHRMNTKEQADLARFCVRHKYRSWFVAPPESINEYGRAYSTGGVVILVKAEKRCHEINRHADDSGQALMLQIDQAWETSTKNRSLLLVGHRSLKLVRLDSLLTNRALLFQPDGVAKGALIGHVPHTLTFSKISSMTIQQWPITKS